MACVVAGRDKRDIDGCSHRSTSIALGYLGELLAYSAHIDESVTSHRGFEVFTRGKGDAQATEE